MFPLVLTGLILYQVIGSLQSNDCYVLRLICREDPKCVDDAVFYSKCVESFGESQENSPKDLINKPVAWADKDNPKHTVYIEKRKIDYNNLFNTHGHEKKQIQNLNDIYSDYQRESIRESLFLLKKHLHDQKDNGEINHLSDVTDIKSKYIDINIKSVDTDINSSDADITSSKADVIHESVDDSISFPSDDSNHIFNREHNTNNKKEVLKYNDNLVKTDVSSVKDISVESLQVEERKRNVINKAFNLVRSLINEGESHENPDTTPGKYKRKVLQDNEPITPLHATHGKSDVNIHGTDRLEIGVPVYGEDIEDEKEKKKSVGTEQDRGLLFLNTSNSLSNDNAVKVGKVLGILLWNISHHKIFNLQSVEENNVVYLMKIDSSWFKFDDNADKVANRINADEDLRADLSKVAGAVILSAASSNQNAYSAFPVGLNDERTADKLTLFSAIIAASVLGLLFAVIVVCVIKRKGKSLTPLIFRRQEAVQDYQELCRTQMSVANSPRPEEEIEKNGAMKTWNDEQSPYNMDITTGHVILAYMEDHLKNENRLNKEWEALCSYKADENETLSGSDIKHTTKNRYRDVLPYDHTRVKLRDTTNAFHSDYINASFITDTDPRNPSYIATQGPLDNTVQDFWQMIWEQGVVVIINLTKLSDMGLPQCHHYWPLDGSEIYHIYEVHLISEHIWCDDYLVRSLYLKNLQTAETRTVTQFHYLTWPDLSIPTSPKPLLEFRRKVNKCYRGHACPVVVHCNNGVGRTGTYILLDMVLNKMIKGTKEIDIAATLEHLRDQRQDFVKTKGQFEFALLAVAEEVTAILSSVAR